jgi:pyrroline-5-carboxylate reductase
MEMVQQQLVVQAVAQGISLRKSRQLAAQLVEQVTSRKKSQHHVAQLAVQVISRILKKLEAAGYAKNGSF